MTGFRLSWRIQNSPMLINSTTPGQEIETPQFGETGQNPSNHYNRSQDYTANIFVPEDMAETESLIVAIEVDTNEGSAETVTVTEEIPGSEKYKLYKEKKNWTEANAQCEKDGGHLASILSPEEYKAAVDVVGTKYAWIGGRKKAENDPWQWADGSDWGFSEWQNGKPNGWPWRCANMNKKKWSDFKCASEQSFLCQTFRKTFAGKKNLTFEFSAENVTSARLSVSYRHRVNEEQLATKWNNAKIGGFRLKWFVQNKTDTQQVCENCTEWRPKEVKPQYLPTKDWLAKMARLSKQLNGSLEEDVRQVLEVKLSNKRFLNNSDVWCFDGQIKETYHSKIFDEILRELNYNETDQDDVDSEEYDLNDLKAGFLMFSSIVFCPKTVRDLKLYNFLDDLISNESPRTLIQGIVNTLGSKDLDGKSSKNLDDFFQALNDMMALKFGKILLASSSPAKLKSMLDRGLPYVTKYKDDIEMTTNSSNMQSILESGEIE